MFCVLVALLALSMSPGVALGSGIGDRLVRTYTKYVTLPDTMSAAEKAGWKPMNASKNCVPSLGVAYVLPDDDIAWIKAGPSKRHPLTLYFTPFGQSSGIAVNVFGDEKSALVERGFWRKVENTHGEDWGKFKLAVGFRYGRDACSAKALPEILGDRVVLNPDTNKPFAMPLTTSEAVKDKYQRGSCFQSMGHHYFLDLVDGPQMSWEAANLLPVVPMYNSNGTLNAFFFASSSVQQSMFNANWWEPVPLANPLMCKNFCNSNCTFHDTSFFSTMHVYLNDYENVNCANGCKMGCCP